MSEQNLELLIEEPKSLKQELADSIRKYPTTLRAYTKTMAPALVVSTLGAMAGQWGAVELGYDSNTAATAAAYVCGYLPGYSAFFGLEYVRNRKDYPKGVFSKEFGKFVGTFFAADYVADLSTFTPTFITLNVWLANNTDWHPTARSLAAWSVGAACYLVSISALHPVTQRINNAINTRVKHAYHAIRTRCSRATRPSTDLESE